MTTIKFASLCLLSISLNSAFALELLPEEEMSQTTAQDGISFLVQLPASGFKIQYINLQDTTGIPNTVKPGYEFNRGDLLMYNLGVKTCLEGTINGSCTSIAAATLNLSLDAVGETDGNTATPDAMLNIALSLTGGAQKVRFYLDKLSLRNGFGANEVAFIDFGGRTGGDIDANGDYVDIVPVGGGTLMSLQFGNETAGHMLHLTNAQFGSIDFGTIFLRDKGDTVNGGACASCNLNFGFKMDNVDITNAGFDFGSDGLVFSFSSAPLAPGIDVTFSNIKAGTAVDMGSIGMRGVKVTNFALAITGKS